MILTVIDGHSKSIDAILLSTATASITVQQLRKIFAQFGLPDMIVSDNGTQRATRYDLKMEVEKLELIGTSMRWR